MTTTLTNYQQAARTLLDQAFEDLAAGDLPQASKKGWEAADHMLKAVAQQRGWEYQNTAAYYRVAMKIVAETGEDQIRSWSAVARSLLNNFYDNLAYPEYTAGGLKNVRKLIDRLEQLLETE